MADYTSNYSSNGLEVSLSVNPMDTSQLTAYVVTEHYTRNDILSVEEVHHVWKTAKDLWWRKRQGISPLDNLARVYHNLIV